jgi:lantibiotic biosynthesis protein
MSSDPSPFLEAASRLASSIASSAIWFEGRCNWVGAVSREGPGQPGLEAAALGPDLYEGTSGLALFLAEAAGRLDDDRLRTVALGAIRHALDHAHRIAPEARDGLYAGSIGIVYAATRVAALLEAGDVLTRSRDLLVGWHRDGRRSRSSDVMSGCAGAVVGLVALTELIEEPWLVDAAVALGDELIARAHRGRAGWSWPAPGRRRMHNLCGYAHGAAGMGHALAELHGVTGEARHRDAAECAFEYERSWLDPCTGTWPDLRGVARGAAPDAPVPAADSWCNGAPGIALSRLRAAELLGSAELRRDADLAVAACERYLAGLLVVAPDDFCLCHGAAGAADVQVGADLAGRIGRRGIELYLRRGASGFPCGVPLGETPGLMLGFGGIGMFYLRLHDPSVPSPLLIARRLDTGFAHSIGSH